MSSPFATFRKHKNYWMAGMVLLAILAFIVAPAIDSMMDYMRSSGDPGNDVVVRWSDGKITSGTVNYIRARHARTIRFLQSLAREVIANGGMPKVPGFRYDPTNKRVEDLGLPMLDSNRAVCQTMIIAERAKQLGIQFEKPVVDDFFKRFCDRKISSARFEELLKETAGRDLPVSELYRQLELELSAVVMERVALAGVNYEGMPLVTPGNLWQNYLRLNQSARVEAYPVLTRDFIKQVKESPSDAEIRALYEAGADNFPSPNSPEPGFRRRYQANIEYVSGSWNQMLEIEKAKISDEALKAEYDRQVALGGLKVPVDAAPSPEGSPQPAPQGGEASGVVPKPENQSTKPAGEGDKPAEPTAAKPDAGQAPAPVGSPRDDSKDAKPADDKPADDKATDDKPVDDKPVDDKPAEDKGADDQPAGNKPEANAQPDAQDQSRSSGRQGPSAVRLVAFQQNDALPPPVANPAPPQEATTTGTSASQPTTGSTGESAAAAAAGATAGTSAGAAASPPMRTQTFEEAKDSLARSLAMNTVRDQLQAKLGKIETAMNAYASSRTMEQANIEAGRKTDKKVVPVDLKKLAEAEGLTYGSTGMSDGMRLASTPIGRSMIGNQSLANSIMTPAVELFRPVRSMFIDMENVSEPDFQEFVSWKTQEVAAYTPALTDIREEVIEAWKTQRARVLAKEESEKLADKLKKAGDEPWKATLDAQQQTLVISPPPFTWMSAPREMFAPAQISFVQGLDTVGAEFMQRVFSTQAGQVVVAPNQGLTTYYVTRVVELSPTLDQLQQNFEVSRGRARQLAFSERERLFSEWYDNIERTLGVQWLASTETLFD